jgi:hypothetical protein
VIADCLECLDGKLSGVEHPVVRWAKPSEIVWRVVAGIVIEVRYLQRGAVPLLAAKDTASEGMRLLGDASGLALVS